MSTVVLIQENCFKLMKKICTWDILCAHICCINIQSYARKMKLFYNHPVRDVFYHYYVLPRRVFPGDSGHCPFPRKTRLNSNGLVAFGQDKKQRSRVETQRKISASACSIRPLLFICSPQRVIISTSLRKNVRTI